MGWYFKVFVLFVFMLLSYSGVSAEDKKVVSVMDFEAVGIDPSVSTQLTSAMVSHLVELGLFKVVDRDQIESVMREQAFQQSGGCSDEACFVEMGQLLGVQQMVFGKIGKLENNYTVTVKLLNVETGEIEKSKFYMHEGTLSSLFRDKTKEIVEDVLEVKQYVPHSGAVHASEMEINKPDVDNKKPSGESQLTKRIVQGILGAVTIGGGVFGYMQDRSLSDTKVEYNAVGNDEDTRDVSDKETAATSLGEDMDNYKSMRNIGYIAASVALVSFTVVTITF